MRVALTTILTSTLKFEELRMATTKPRPLAIVTGASSGIGYELGDPSAGHVDLVNSDPERA